MRSWGMRCGRLRWGWGCNPGRQRVAVRVSAVRRPNSGCAVISWCHAAELMQCANFVGAGLLANEVSQSPSLFDETGIGRFVVVGA